jgi:molecular chaperone HscC
VIPASRVERVSTTQPNQTAVNVEVYQGESRLIADNIHLGTLKVKLPPSQELQPIDVRFTYDINGLLEVEVTTLETGAVERAVIQRGSGNMADEDLQRRLRELDALKLHPRDEAENAAVLAWGRRLFEERLGDERAYVSALLGRFEAVLEEQDSRRAKIAAAELREALRALDNDGWL